MKCRRRLLGRGERVDQPEEGDRAERDADLGARGERRLLRLGLGGRSGSGGRGGGDLHGRRRPGGLPVLHDRDAALDDVVEVQRQVAVLLRGQQA
nr:hypothetical protein [Nocardioides convexus]